jgi:hypothetical protein
LIKLFLPHEEVSQALKLPKLPRRVIVKEVGVGRRYLLWSEYVVLLLRFSSTKWVYEIEHTTRDVKVWARQKG